MKPRDKAFGLPLAFLAFVMKPWSLLRQSSVPARDISWWVPPTVSGPSEIVARVGHTRGMLDVVRFKLLT